VWLQRSICVASLFAVAACGASRSTRTLSNCSRTKAVVDKSVNSQSVAETYDPSAVLLIFKATSDKIAIESRCNARLVNKLLAKHKQPNGELIDASAPINFSQLQLQLESGDKNFELHTSAHCFYRVWDPRIKHQVEQNAALGAEPNRSLLQDATTRYQLYRSMLTSPQTVVAFLPDRTPVSFNYTQKATEVYENFFAEIDKLRSMELQKTVGREFSKSSVLLDEMIMDVCQSNEKMHKDLVRSGGSTDRVTNVLSLGSYINNLRNRKPLEEIVKTGFVTSGRHKLCFSQTDMIAVPVQFVGTLNDMQKSMLNQIEQFQTQKVNQFKSSLAGAADSSTPFIAEITPTTKPLPTPEGLSTCSYSKKYPGFSITDVFAQKIEKTYSPHWIATNELGRANLQQFKKIFKNLSIDSDAAEPFVTAYVNSVLAEEKCRFSGFVFDGATMQCTTKPDEEIGKCPLPPRQDSQEEIAAADAKAQEIHEHIKSSLRLASTAPIHVLRRMRDSSLLALTMPIASLRDFIFLSCENARDPSCSSARQLERILDSMAGRHLALVDGEKTDISKINDRISVSNVDADKQILCKIQPRDLKSITPDTTTPLFENLSEDALRILGESKPENGRNPYWNFAARFLYLKCVSSGMQRLYNGYQEYSGLLHGVKFLEVSFVTSDNLSLNGKTALSNSDMIELGQPVNIPLPALFMGMNETTKKMSAPEVAARILGAPHLQISSCLSAGASRTGICSNLQTNFERSDNPAEQQNIYTKLTLDLPLVKAHLNFTTQVPQWLSSAEKEKYGPVTFPPANYSNESSRYFLSAGDSGTTVSSFGLWPVFILSTVQDSPVSGGLAVIPTSGRQDVQASQSGSCR